MPVGSFRDRIAYLQAVKAGCLSLGGGLRRFEPYFRPGPFFENEARWREDHLHPHYYRHVHLYVIWGCSVSPMGLETALFRRDRPGRDDQSRCGSSPTDLLSRSRGGGGGGSSGNFLQALSLIELYGLPPPIHPVTEWQG